MILPFFNYMFDLLATTFDVPRDFNCLTLPPKKILKSKFCYLQTIRRPLMLVSNLSENAFTYLKPFFEVDLDAAFLRKYHFRPCLQQHLLLQITDSTNVDDFVVSKKIILTNSTFLIGNGLVISKYLFIAKKNCLKISKPMSEKGGYYGLGHFGQELTGGEVNIMTSFITFLFFLYF